MPDYTAEFGFNEPKEIYVYTNSNWESFKILLGLDETTSDNPIFDTEMKALQYNSDTMKAILVGDTTYQF